MASKSVALQSRGGTVNHHEESEEHEGEKFAVKFHLSLMSLSGLRVLHALLRGEWNQSKPVS
jgi:hypothetical protein